MEIKTLLRSTWIDVKIIREFNNGCIMKVYVSSSKVVPNRIGDTKQRLSLVYYLVFRLRR